MEGKRDVRRWCKNCGEKVGYDAPPDQVDCDNCITEAEEREAEEDDTCPTCNGCGEGQFEGTKCMTCHGRGTILTEAHQEAFDAVADRQEDARQEALEAQREMQEPPGAGYPDYGDDYPVDSEHRQDEARRMK
jgi:DnaJ-class molecular chaperone